MSVTQFPYTRPFFIHINNYFLLVSTCSLSRYRSLPSLFHVSNINNNQTANSLNNSEKGPTEISSKEEEIQLPEVVVEPDYFLDESYREAQETTDMIKNDVKYVYLDLNLAMKERFLTAKAKQKSIKLEKARSRYFDLQEKENEDDSEDEEDEDEDDEEEIEKENLESNPYSPAQKRLAKLTSKLDDVSRGFHPRRSEENDGSVFFPMLFSGDITYFPFPVLSNEGIEVDDDGDEEERRRKSLLTDKYSRIRKSIPKIVIEKEVSPYRDAADCSDITARVTARKVQLENERLQQLYRTSHAEIPAENWTLILKRQEVNWEKFMIREQRSRTRFITEEIRNNNEKDNGIVGQEFFKSRLKNALYQSESSDSDDMNDDISNIDHDNYENKFKDNPGDKEYNQLLNEKQMKKEKNILDTSVFSLHGNGTGTHSGIKSSNKNVRDSNKGGKNGSDGKSEAYVAPKPTPLPFGKVIEDLCEINSPHYYYVSTAYLFRYLLSSLLLCKYCVYYFDICCHYCHCGYYC